MNVAIINNGGANMNSLVYALERLKLTPVLTSDADTIARSSHVILPGVGHATDSMARLTQSAMADLVGSLTQPVLGICLGMQLMYAFSEEGDTPCLNVLHGNVTTMTGTVERPAPHMGWNQIAMRQSHPLLAGIDDGAYFYFVHGYTAEINAHTVASSDYGYEFTSIAARDNFVGVQFHPERSGAVGAQLLNNFVTMT